MSYLRNLIASSLAAGFLLLASFETQAAIFAVNGGTAAPAATLGPYTMTPFGPDNTNPLSAPSSNVPSPLGGDLGLSPAQNHHTIGSGWATWSHGYTGDVYSDLSSTVMQLTLPANTGAFYFYAEPNPFSDILITAESQDGTILNELVQGNSGASYFGFYGTSGDSIALITVSSATNFAVPSLTRTWPGS